MTAYNRIEETTMKLLFILCIFLSGCASTPKDDIWYETYLIHKDDRETKDTTHPCLDFATELREKLATAGIPSTIKTTEYKWRLHAYVQAGDECADNGYISPMGWFECAELNR